LGREDRFGRGDRKVTGRWEGKEEWNKIRYNNI